MPIWMPVLTLFSTLDLSDTVGIVNHRETKGGTEMANKRSYIVHLVDLGTDREFPSVTEMQEALLEKFYWLMVDVITDGTS